MASPATTDASIFRRPPPDHFVQFYQDEAVVLAKIARRAASALRIGSSSVIIATAPHRAEIESRLVRRGVNIEDFTLEGRYVMLDAGETLAQFMVDGWPDEARFNQVVGGVLGQAIARSADHRVTAFGEMVALLCAAGNAQAAIRLERLWNELGTRFTFSLLCAYPLNLFANDHEADALLQVCAEHDRAIPAETSS